MARRLRDARATTHSASARRLLNQPPMNRLAIARALSETADLLALTGHEPFRARAYERGARVLERLSDRDLERLVAEGRLTTLGGIGHGLATVIDDLARAGRSEVLEKVPGAVPA